MCSQAETAFTLTPSRHPIENPDIEVSVRQVFGINSDMMVPAFSG